MITCEVWAATAPGARRDVGISFPWKKSSKIAPKQQRLTHSEHIEFVKHHQYPKFIGRYAAWAPKSRASRTGGAACLLQLADARKQVFEDAHGEPARLHNPRNE